MPDNYTQPIKKVCRERYGDDNPKIIPKKPPSVTRGGGKRKRKINQVREKWNIQGEEGEHLRGITRGDFRRTGPRTLDVYQVRTKRKLSRKEDGKTIELDVIVNYDSQGNEIKEKRLMEC